MTEARYVNEVRFSIDKRPQCTLRICAHPQGYVLVANRGDEIHQFPVVESYAEAKAHLFRFMGQLLSEPIA